MSARDVRALAGELLHALADRIVPRAREARPPVLHQHAVDELVPIVPPGAHVHWVTRAPGCVCANPYVAGGMRGDCPVHGLPSFLQGEDGAP